MLSAGKKVPARDIKTGHFRQKAGAKTAGEAVSSDRDGINGQAGYRGNTDTAAHRAAPGTAI